MRKFMFTRQVQACLDVWTMYTGVLRDVLDFPTLFGIKNKEMLVSGDILDIPGHNDTQIPTYLSYIQITSIQHHQQRKIIFLDVSCTLM